MGVDITGLNELIEKFEESGGDIRPVMKKAIRVGARIVKAEIASRAPIRPDAPSGDALPPGALKSDISIRTLKDTGADEAVSIQPGKLTAHIARFVEFGHRLVKGGRNHIKRGGPGKVIGHVPAHPFVRPAFEASQKPVQDAIEESLAKSLQKVFGK